MKKTENKDVAKGVEQAKARPSETRALSGRKGFGCKSRKTESSYSCNGQNLSNN